MYSSKHTLSTELQTQAHMPVSYFVYVRIVYSNATFEREMRTRFRQYNICVTVKNQCACSNLNIGFLCTFGRTGEFTQC